MATATPSPAPMRRPAPNIFEPRTVPIQIPRLASSAAAAATPPPAQPPEVAPAPVRKSTAAYPETYANSPGSAKAAEEVSNLVSAMNGANIQAIFSEYDAYRAFQKGGRKGGRPNTQRLDAARTQIAPIDLQAAFKGLAMIAGKNYTRTTPGAPFTAVGPFKGTQKRLVNAKQQVVGMVASGPPKKGFLSLFKRNPRGGASTRKRRTPKRRTMKRRS